VNFKIYFLITGILFCFCAQAQDDGFTPYNKKRILCCFEGKHALLGSLNYTIDLDSKESTGGNVPPGMNYGFGIGYSYNILVDDYPQAVAIGAKAEWYPGSFFKFNTLLEFDLLGMGIGPVSAFFISGLENQITFTKDFKENEWHSILYLLELNIYNFEIKWGLDSNWNVFKPNQYIDDTFNVLKLTYRHFL